MDDECRTCRDLRELLQRERERARVAEAASLSKDRLLSVSATEWSSLVQSLLGWTQTLQRGVLSAASRANALEIMERRLTTHLTLLEEMLDVSGNDAPQLQLSALDVEDVLRALPGREVAAPSEPMLVVGDRARLAASLARVAEALGGEVVARVSKERPEMVSVVLEAPGASEKLAAGSLARTLATATARLHGGSFLVEEGACIMHLPAFVSLEEAPPSRGGERTAIVLERDSDLAALVGLSLRDRGVTALVTPDEELIMQAQRIHDAHLVIVESEETGARLREQSQGAFRVAVVDHPSKIAAALDG